MKSIMQGDAYSIPIRIRSGNVEITPDMVESIEFVIGSITKSYPNEVSFTDSWQFPLTQEESFQLSPNMQPLQIRIKFLSGEIIGRKYGCISIESSISKAVL